MTELLSRLDEPGDAELISAVRGGDVTAYGSLFERHAEAARRLARQLVGPGDADDLVSDAFAKVLNVLQKGGGPDLAFRAYLLTAVRRLHVDKIRSTARLHSTDNMEMFDPGVPFRDTAVEGFENAAAAKAFASLPERWQLVLWHMEVEGQKPADIAPLLGMSANSVSALAYRAREGLRQAFLNSHVQDLDDAECRWTHDHLGAYIRNGVSKRDATKVEKHLDECRKCMAIYLELTEVNSGLAGILAPLLLGTAGAGYLASTGAAAKGGLLLLLDRAKDAVAANSTTAAVGGVAAATVVAGAAIAVVAAGGDDPAGRPDRVANPDASVTAPVAPPTQAPTRGPTAPPPSAIVPPPVVIPSEAVAEETVPEPVTSEPPVTEAPVAEEPPVTVPPVTTPPPPPTFDLALALTRDDRGGGVSDVTLSVTGSGPGAWGATLVLTRGLSILSLPVPHWTLPDGCVQTTTVRADCQVSDTVRTYVVKVRQDPGSFVTAEVVPTGFSDVAPANNKQTWSEPLVGRLLGLLGLGPR